MSRHAALSFICLLTAVMTVSSTGQIPIRMIYPREGMTVSTADSLLVLGRVQGSGQLFVDGHLQKVESDGSFVGYVPLDRSRAHSDSTYLIRCELRSPDTTHLLERKIRLPLPMPEWTTVGFDSDFLFPRDRHVLAPGDIVQVACRTRSGRYVGFELIDSTMRVLDGPYSMAEDEPYIMPDFGNAFYGFEDRLRRRATKGLYSASYVIPHTEISNARIRFFTTDSLDTLRITAPGLTSTWKNNPLRIARIAADVNNAMVWPNRSFMYFLPKGTWVRATGQIGEFVRLQLSDRHSAWLRSSQLEWMADGVVLPRSPISVVRVKTEGRQTTIRLFMSSPLPFHVQQPEPRRIECRVFGAIADVDWIRFENEDNRIRQVTWSQPEDDVFQITVDLKEPYLWGYRVEHDSLGLKWTLRHPPEKKKLKNLRICVDPGHSPDAGATGPSGLQEQEANLLVAVELKKKLEDKGATVIMTRTDTVDRLSLYDRVRMANQSKADLFVSIHHNAQPDGVNPRGQPFGPMMIYYYPQSRPLAEAIQKQLVRETELPDMGVFMGNIAVCRNAEMPAVLVECAFMTLPEQERLIRDKDFRKDVAKGILKGIENFVKGRK